MNLLVQFFKWIKNTVGLCNIILPIIIVILIQGNKKNKIGTQTWLRTAHNLPIKHSRNFLRNVETETYTFCIQLFGALQKP